MPTVVLIQLLVDIETHGGLHGPCSLKALCDLRPDVFGQVGSARRRAIQNRVTRLKAMARSAYLNLLSVYSIPAFQPVAMPPMVYCPMPRMVYCSMPPLPPKHAAFATNTRELSMPLLRLLLQDIQANGGYKNFSLRTVCKSFTATRAPCCVAQCKTRRITSKA